jgi:Leucine-rich repeat (LRR) protein|tara:strand:+ start:42 stop:470 length:429 start_codon:yes stop_codon:yes gene_type:complete
MVVTENTARVEVFQSIFSIINTNKLSGTTVLATFPEKSPTFPCYVLNSPEITNDSLAFDTGSRQIDFTMNIEFFGDARDGMQKIDQMKDNVVASLRDSTNVASLKSDKISIMNIEDDLNDQVEFKEMKINTGELSVQGVILL